MPRILRTAGSFAIVLVCYWTYALVAVPLIEPPADLKKIEPITEENRAGGSRLVDQRLGSWKDLFPPDAWQRKSPKVLDSDRVTLLMDDYRNLGDGRVELVPFTVIFAPEKPADGEDPDIRQAVILDAPEGALLEFDEPFNLHRAKVGRLKGGRLKGRVTIRSEGKRPGPEDDLLVVTRDVQLTEQNVWTPHAVDFRWGPHSGRGHQMHIKLLPGKETKREKQRGPNVGGVESFKLQRIERLHLELGKAKLLPADDPRGAAGTPAGKAKDPTKGLLGPTANLPIEVVCQGPFCFDVARKVATFKDRVDVLRVNPDGPSDQLNCELLSIFFVEGTEATPGDPKDAKNVANKEKEHASSFDLKPQRIEAQGNPVVVSAPSERVYGRGKRLQYDLQTNLIVLDGAEEVMLRRETSEIHARRLQYQSMGPGRLGQITAKGPGWLRGQMDQRPDQLLEAHWTEQLSVRPHGGNQVISLSGGARLKFRGIGQLDAREVHFWLSESPSPVAAGQSQLRPDRMLARDDVRVSSPQLSAAVEQLEIWFKGTAKAESSTPPISAVGQYTATVYRLPPTGQMAAARPAPRQHFDVTGRLLQGLVRLPEDGDPQISELTIEDNVRLAETQTTQPDELPLLILGDRVHAVHANQPQATVTVTGRPAHFEGRGLSLTGPNINLNRGTNRLWVDGAGAMDVPLEKDLKGRPLSRPGVLKVRWKNRMVFDGRKARFEETVTAAGPQQQLQTETLEVHFERPIDFADAKIRQTPQVEQILCRGGVLMENLTVEGPEQTSHEQMQVVDLAVNLISGALTAGGPGWLNSVHRGSFDLSATVTDQNPANHDQLRCLHVRFQGQITGNVNQRSMSFHDQVQTAYAAVDTFDATLDVDDPEALGPEGVVMSCDRLTVNEMEATSGNSWELEALGNVVAEGRQKTGIYTARGARMTYAEAKDLLILEGDGRTHATLFRQQRLGGRRDELSARKIFFRPKTNQLKLDGVRAGELNWMPTGDQP